MTKDASARLGCHGTRVVPHGESALALICTQRCPAFQQSDIRAKIVSPGGARPAGSESVGGTPPRSAGSRPLKGRKGKTGKR